MSCIPCEGSVFGFPRRTGGSESKEGSGAGGVKPPDGYFPIAYAITSCHKGAMMKAAIFFCMEELSLLPAHAPTATLGVYPMIHASR